MNLPDRFILYLRQWDAAKNKWQKIPCDRHGMKIDPHQPEVWMTYEEASQHALWDESKPGYPYGVGFVFNGDGWFLLDLDDALGDDGQWKPDADLLFRSFTGVYGEVSTSGNGLHVIGMCQPDQLQDRKNKWNGDREFYMDGRFVALSQGGLTLRGDAITDQTAMLLKVVPQREFLGDLPDGRDPAYTGPEDDDELIRMMLRSGGSAAAAFGGGVTVAQLWEADAVAIGQKYPDPVREYDASGADMALMSHLAFWTGKDMPRMERLARRSGLARDKWDKHRTYLRDTVQKAARLCSRVYDRPRAQVVELGTTQASTSPAPGFMTVHEQMLYFAGCTYVREVHKVLIPTGELLKPDQFRATFGGYEFAMDMESGKSTKNAFECLTESRAFRFPKVRGVMFRPDLPFGEVMDDHVNTYIPHNPHVVEGDITPFTRHMEKLFPDPTDREIILCYMAAVVQYPGRRFRWAPLIQGVEGNGKTLLAMCLKYVLGKQYCHDPRQDEMTEKYNDWMVDKLLIIVEEAWAKGRSEVMEFLKPLITNAQFEYRGMAQAKVMRDRTFNWFFCSNHKDALLKTKNDRRIAPFFTPQQDEGDLARDGMDGDYFPNLYSWLENGGFAHVAHFLLNFAINPKYNPGESCHRAPTTTSTNAAISASSGGVEAEITEAIEAELPGFRGDWISTHCLMALMRESGYKVTRPKLSEILQQMGYERWGRAPARITLEANNRPYLWRRKDAPEATFQDYLQSQSAGGAPYL